MLKPDSTIFLSFFFGYPLLFFSSLDVVLKNR